MIRGLRYEHRTQEKIGPQISPRSRLKNPTF